MKAPQAATSAKSKKIVAEALKSAPDKWNETHAVGERHSWLSAPREYLRAFVKDVRSVRQHRTRRPRPRVRPPGDPPHPPRRLGRRTPPLRGCSHRVQAGRRPAGSRRAPRRGLHRRQPARDRGEPGPGDEARPRRHGGLLLHHRRRRRDPRRRPGGAAPGRADVSPEPHQPGDGGEGHLGGGRHLRGERVHRVALPRRRVHPRRAARPIVPGAHLLQQEEQARIVESQRGTSRRHARVRAGRAEPPGPGAEAVRAVQRQVGHDGVRVRARG